MASCCDDKSCEISALKEKHGKVLKIALAINLAMFFVELAGGWMAHSNSLMADALDMLGDATVYTISLFVLSKSLTEQARVSLLKAFLMMVMGIFVLADAGYKMFIPSMPETLTMGAVGAVALVANLICFILLYTHRDDDINMSSTWLCSRNDLIANSAVIAGAGLCYILASKWPDILIGVSIAILFLRSSLHIAKEARVVINKPPQRAPIPIPVKIVTKQ